MDVVATYRIEASATQKSNVNNPLSSVERIIA